MLIIRNLSISNLTEQIIFSHASISSNWMEPDTRHISPLSLEVDTGVFYSKDPKAPFSGVSVLQLAGNIITSCSCNNSNDAACQHEVAVLLAILRKEDHKAFFDPEVRRAILRKFAFDYGLEKEADLDAFFKLEYLYNTITVTPRSASLLPITRESLAAMQTIIVPDVLPPALADNAYCLVLKEHKYYKYLLIELYKGQYTQAGKIKNPLTIQPPLDLIWETQDPEKVKFFTGVHKFQDHRQKAPAETDITALKAVVSNPLNYDSYYHDADVSENVTAGSIHPVKIGIVNSELKLTVSAKDQFFEIAGTIEIDGRQFKLSDLTVKFTYFLWTGAGLYLAADLQQLKLITLLTKSKENLLIHASKFEELQKQVLSKLEEKVAINYTDIKTATAAQLTAAGFDNEVEKIIYLSDFGAHVMIIPVMRYGEVEISIRTKKQIYSKDDRGKTFLVHRDDEQENNFTALLIRQHPFFEEQLEDDLHYFYLHKKHFLDEEWFPDVFEAWQDHHITILGFNELEGNKLNPYKVKINIKVLSGINWFNVVIDGRFGRQKAALKQIYRAVKNKSKYVQLDDGTTGILPAEWLTRFADYFNAGEIAADDTLQISRSNFSVIEQLFDQFMLDEEVRNELINYRQKLAGFESFKSIEVPADLKGELRPYQQQGLNWLNFLDEYNFGGCLADDMGLGKTVQVIALLLSQRNKDTKNVNLIVVPTSLIFNWQQEIEKFAPSMRVHTLYGAERIKSADAFEGYEVVLTSYGTLIADIVFLKNHHFNYVILDESQQIKNPGSQRYKAACLLRSRNRLILTGTPIENNTFDLYAQLSFACPGLLGSKIYFKQIYSTPIDLFKSSQRALELQSKVGPFILRRSKQQVAKDLPEKTEMVVYCEMTPGQRTIYDAYEKEFRDLISATTGEELKKDAMNVLKGITRLRQICDSPLLIKDEKMPGNASAKLEVLLEQIEEKMHQHKILVFSQFVGMLELVKNELDKRDVKYSYLTGQTRNRQAAIEKFQNEPSVRVFLISLKAGGTGLNLTEADYVYLVDPWWNPAVENQAIDRCHRIGQDKHVVAVRLICSNTVEEKMMVLQETKNSLAEQLIKTDSSMIKSLSKTDLLNLLT